MTARTDLVSALSSLVTRIIDAIAAIGRGNYDEAADTLEAGVTETREAIAALRGDNA